MTRKQLLGRLVIAYCLVPALTPFLLLNLSSLDWPMTVLVFGIFGYGALAVLGTPLLLCYLKLGWTGFLPFMLGGGACAAITAYTFLGRDEGLNTLWPFATAGLVSGLTFRILLFGFRTKVKWSL